jgi:signal transduction histidine kinase/DNA-binding LacI/PurR family transcriptional regulator/CheY-like chemotaxis protein/HPt (histidine-containing phosphotransfer) domain-containing protein
MGAKEYRIGLTLANIDSGWAQNVWLPFVTTALNEGKSLFIFPGGRLNAPMNSENIRNAVYSLVNGENLDGFISHSSSIIFVKPQELDFHSRFFSLPFVTLAFKVPGHPCVDFDAYTGMKQLILHSICVHGARRIAFIRGPAFHPSAQIRLKAYHDALEESGLPSLPDSPLVTDPFHWGNGTEAAAQLFEKRKLRPGEDFDTLVGSNDLMALEAMEYFSQKGYNVPRDYHALGFDDSLDSRFAESPLSTVRVPYSAMGREASRIIQELLDKSPPGGGTSAITEDLFMPAEPVFRESCGCRNMYRLPADEAGQEFYEAPARQDLAEPAAAYFELTAREAGAVIRPMTRAWYRVFPENGSEIFSQPMAKSFLNRFEKALVRFFKARGDPGQVFRFLNYACKTGLVQPSQIRKLEPDIYRAIFSARERLAVAAQYERTKLNAVLNSLRYELLGTRERNSLVQSLSKHLPKFGINTAGIALYKDSETSIWAGSFSPDGASPAREEPFPAKKLAPEPLKQYFSRGIFMVQPLFTENRSLGYFIHNVPGNDGIILEELRSIVSYALKGIIQAEEVESARQRMKESEEQSRVLALQKEAAQAASEAKSQFLTNMSHEIRTPMNAVLGMTELLLSEDLNKRQQGYAEDIRTSAMALLDIINDILDISKIQSGKMTLNPAHFDFSALIDNICSMVRFLITGKELVFETETRGEIPKYLYGDDVRLRQVLLNVLGNAVKFTNVGYVRLTVVASDEEIRFTVSDTGIGIRREEIPRIFDAFMQADDVQSRNRKGTGLGLSISKSLVEMMGGHISAESEYGEGTIFRIDIPKVIGDGAKIRHADAGENVVFTPAVKVLAVDDNLINLNVVCGLLRLCNVTVFTAESGREAVEMAGRDRYDLIFMDHMMPEMDGLEAAKALREKGVKAPIIALTANAVTRAKEMMLAAGMDDFLPKPIVRSALNEMLVKWLPGSEFTRQKIEPTGDGDKMPEKQKKFWDAVKKIESLSVRVGLERVSGKYDAYREMLHLSVKEIERCCGKLDRYLAAGDLRNFTIEAHSMKSSLANLGAMGLSGEANGLEAAAARSDGAFCATNLAPFLGALGDLGGKIKEAFSELEEGSDPVAAPPELGLILARLKGAMDEIEYVRINEELKNLDGLDMGDVLKGRVEEIKASVIIMDYDSAAEGIQKLLQKQHNEEAPG